MDADAAAGRFPAQLMVDKSSRSNITLKRILRTGVPKYWGTGVQKKALVWFCASSVLVPTRAEAIEGRFPSRHVHSCKGAHSATAEDQER